MYVKISKDKKQSTLSFYFPNSFNYNIFVIGIQSKGTYNSITFYSIRMFILVICKRDHNIGKLRVLLKKVYTKII